MPRLLAPLLLLTACGGPATWSTLDAVSGDAALSGVWGSGPDDVWIVGGDTTGGRAFQGSADNWAEEDVPDGSGLLVWAYGFGPDDVFAVGRGGTALRWDGLSWATLPTGTTEDLWGVFGFASDDLWVVGGNVGDDVPVLLHWDGSTFSPVTLMPTQNNRSATSLFKVWGVDGTLFAVGERGLIVQGSGTDWEQVAAGSKADDDFVSLWGTSADQMVAVGGRSNARVATWDGSMWDTVAPSGVGGLNAVAMEGPETAVVGGVYGYVGTFDVATGALTPEAVSTGLDLHAMWSDGLGNTYAVGGVFAEPFDGVALLRSAR